MIIVTINERKGMIRNDKMSRTQNKSRRLFPIGVKTDQATYKMLEEICQKEELTITDVVEKAIQELYKSLSAQN